MSPVPRKRELSPHPIAHTHERTLALELTRFFANVDGDVDG